MPFTLASFLFVFLPFTVLGYYVVNMLKNKTLNNIYIILASLTFYSLSGIKNTIYLILFSLLIFCMGQVIAKSKNYAPKKNKFILFVTTIVLIMVYYKYALLIFEMFQSINIELLVLSDVVVPLGMSFIMFEAISYLVDVYRGDAKAGSVIDVMLFFVFFPKVTSGPIVLWRDFSSQIVGRVMSVDLFFSGIEKIMIGYAKKSIIADSLGLTVANITSNNMNGIDSITAIVGMLCYFLQIYFDFSGYSDIAIGISRLFGFQFKENFNFPYTSLSIGEFWRRWHISLGTWFREYIYIPLGGNRKYVYANLFIVFLITGIWHGSTFNFVLWGVLHGLLSMLERLVRNKEWYIKTPKFLKWTFTMSFVALTWIIFMLPSFTEALTFYKSMIGIPAGDIYLTYEYFFDVKTITIIVIAFVGAIIGKFSVVSKLKNWAENTKQGVAIKFVTYFIIFILAVLFMVNSLYSPFLYFQF